MHCAGHNYQSNIRQAVLYDYIKSEKHLDDGPPPEDMWRNWSVDLRAIAPTGAERQDNDDGNGMLWPLWWNDPREETLSPRARPAPRL
jgi:hypothetical protein